MLPLHPIRVLIKENLSGLLILYILKLKEMHQQMARLSYQVKVSVAVVQSQTVPVLRRSAVTETRVIPSIGQFGAATLGPVLWEAPWQVGGLPGRPGTSSRGGSSPHTHQQWQELRKAERPCPNLLRLVIFQLGRSWEQRRLELGHPLPTATVSEEKPNPCCQCQAPCNSLGYIAWRKGLGKRCNGSRRG